MKLPFDLELASLLRCPISKDALLLKNKRLITADGKREYSIDNSGIPLFADDVITEDAKLQQAHYNIIADTYVQNLTYPHTLEYTAYLDRSLYETLGNQDLGVMAELCCGHGEAIRLLKGHYNSAVGVDVSQRMLDIARVDSPGSNIAFIQGDAINLPLASDSFDSVVMLGGIHHINDRVALFSEVWRILKPGGRFIWREPVDDFFLWRWIRLAIYRLAPALDHNTEQPLRRISTQSNIENAGFKLNDWKTVGFFGFCLFMNSDVLVFNRLFKFLPGIKRLTRFSTWIDGLITQAPGMKNMGLIVIGTAKKMQSKPP